MSTFLDTLQSQPWFADVAQQFKTLAPDVAPALWESTILSEDANLNTAQPGDGGLAIGLFQEHPDFNAPAGTLWSTLQRSNPATAAAIAAPVMERALQETGTIGSSLSTQLKQIEKYGWNGSLSEDPQRQENLAAILAQGAPTSAGATSTPASSSTPSGVMGHTLYGDLQNFFGGANPLKGTLLDPTVATQFETSVGNQLLIGGILLAMLSGGIALMSASVKS
jgi:hypothetical protein